jgi:hypothetical protein
MLKSMLNLIYRLVGGVGSILLFLLTLPLYSLLVRHKIDPIIEDIIAEAYRNQEKDQ